jgi:hypothetical protein
MHAVARNFIDRLKEVKKPFIIDGNKLVCGRAVFVISPAVDSEKLDFVRFDMPKAVELEDGGYWMLFFVAIIGPEAFCEIQPRMKTSISGHGEFEEDVGDWKLRLFLDPRDRSAAFASLAAAMPQGKGYRMNAADVSLPGCVAGSHV